MANAWVGVSINGGAPIHSSTFTLICKNADELAAFELLSEKTTRTPEGNNVCPKTYTFTFDLKATKAGYYSYQFVRSDGAKGPIQNGTTSVGQLLHVQDTWQLGRSLQNAWVGVSVNGGRPLTASTFTLTCR